VGICLRLEILKKKKKNDGTSTSTHGYRYRSVVGPLPLLNYHVLKLKVNASAVAAEAEALPWRVFFGYPACISRVSCLCGSCVGPLCGPPLRWWVPCGALPSVWVSCLDPLFGSPVWVPCVGPLYVGPLCGSPVWVPRSVALRHVEYTRMMSPARSHAPAYILPKYLTVSLASRCILVYSHFAADPLHPAVSHCIQLYSCQGSTIIQLVSTILIAITPFLVYNHFMITQKMSNLLWSTILNRNHY